MIGYFYITNLFAHAQAHICLSLDRITACVRNNYPTSLYNDVMKIEARKAIVT